MRWLHRGSQGQLHAGKARRVVPRHYVHRGLHQTTKDVLWVHPPTKTDGTTLYMGERGRQTLKGADVGALG